MVSPRKMKARFTIGMKIKMISPRKTSARKKKQMISPRKTSARKKKHAVGISCHACHRREKVDLTCPNCDLSFCGRTLKDKYELVKDPVTGWPCPRCTGVCDCKKCHALYAKMKKFANTCVAEKSCFEDLKRVEAELRICRSYLHAAEEANKQLRVDKIWLAERFSRREKKKLDKIRRLEEELEQKKTHISYLERKVQNLTRYLAVAESRLAAVESHLECKNNELSSLRKFIIECQDAANEVGEKVENVQLAAADVWKETFSSWRM